MSQDPTEEIRQAAMAFSGVANGVSCTQSSFKVGKTAFLFIGPGPKQQGLKAMFKLKASLPEAIELATAHPDRFEVGGTGWVTARFTAGEPLPKGIWERWLAESFEIAYGARPVGKR